MGEIAEDMIDGTACQFCGQYFQDPKKYDYVYTHGYPVVCWDCWNGLDKKDKKNYEKSKVRTV